MRTIGKALMMIALLAALPAQAQQPAKIAVIQSSQFYALPDLEKAQHSLEAEFKPQSHALTQLAERATMLDGEFKKLQAAHAPQAELKAKRAELEAINLDYRRMQEDVEAKYTQRAGVLLAPVMLRIQKSLAKYLQGQGFTSAVDIDVGQSAPPGAIDQTAAFMAWYKTQP